MTLIDEREVYYEQERKRKIFKTLITAIIVLMVIAIILLLIVKIRQSGKIKITLDGTDISSSASSFILKDDNGKIIEENGKIYLSVRDMSNLLGRQYYNSEYKKKSEDKTKCYIRNENEYTSLISGSNLIYKTIVPFKAKSTTNLSSDDFESIPSNEYEYFEMENDVKLVNDMIYADTDAIALAFNVAISYNKDNKTISILTLDYLENIAKETRRDIVDSANYEYVNKKLLKYGMCIIKDSEGNYGVGSYTDKDKSMSCVASCKYSSISFDEAKKVINVVCIDHRSGVISIDMDKQEIANTFITQYDDVKVIDNEFKYFLVEKDNQYGITSAEGNPILAVAYEDIGIDDGLYTDVTNKYIVDDKYIPVKQNGLWGLCDLNGNVLIIPQYSEFGCSLAQSGDSVTVIPNAKEDVDAVVFMYNKDKKLYGIYNAVTGEKMAVSLVEVFKKNEEGEDNYYINHVINKDNGVVHTLNVYKEI